jgi:hypothetical protein
MADVTLSMKFRKIVSLASQAQRAGGLPLSGGIKTRADKLRDAMIEEITNLNPDVRELLEMDE